MQNIKTCNHNIKDKDNTLIKGKKSTMIYPPQYQCFCCVCQKVFSFVMNSNKEFIIEE